MKLIQHSILIQLIILILFGRVYAQGSHKKIELSENLFPKNEKLNPKLFPPGGIKKSSQDFILATGNLWKGKPPKSLGTFSYKDKKIQNSGEFNNLAIQKLKEQGGFDTSVEMLEKGVEFDPHFFPFRYNLGRLYYQKNEFQKALIQFEYATKIIPEYHKTFIHLAKTFNKLGKQYESENAYKKAIRLNPFDTEALVLLGEHFLDLDFPNRANVYFQKALEQNPLDPNSILGKAAILYYSKNYWKTYYLFKKHEMVTKDEKNSDYNIKFHYYFAMSSFKVGDYETSEIEFAKLLKYPLNPFFLEVPYETIIRKRDISKRFALEFQ